LALSECGNRGTETWTFLSRVHDLVVERLESALRDEAGLSLAEHDVLVQVETGGGLIQMGDVARTVLISKSGVTRLVGKLADDGFLERVVFPENRRATFARLTPRGVVALEKSTVVFEREVSATFTDQLSKTDISNLSRSLTKLLSAHGWKPATLCPYAARDGSPGEGSLDVT
jgi:DNA-binding MarR family transcriptional regulator